MGEERHARFGCLGAASHGDELQVRDEERTEQTCRLLPDRALGQVRDEDPAVLHRVAEIKLGPLLAENDAQRRRGGKLPHFVENGASSLRAVPCLVTRVLVAPEAAHGRITDAYKHAFAKAIINVEPW